MIIALSLKLLFPLCCIFLLFSCPELCALCSHPSCCFLPCVGSLVNCSSLSCWHALHLALSLSTSGLCFRSVATPHCQTNVFLSLLPQFHVFTTNKPQASTHFLPTYLPAYQQHTPICAASPPHHASTPGSQHLSIPISAAGIPL